MALISQTTTITELAAIVSQRLNDAGITAVLSGGAAVATYTKNRYESCDLDFVTSSDLKILEAALDGLGFLRKSNRRDFTHPDTDYYLEFPSGPLSVGNALVHEWAIIETGYGQLRILTPTQMVMDRLAAFFYWNDPQSLDQAIWIAEANDIDWTELEQWAQAEETEEKYQVFLDRMGR